MSKFIEYTDAHGVRSLVSLFRISSVIDRNKSILLILDDEKINLPIAYSTFKNWIDEGESSILSAGNAL